MSEAQISNAQRALWTFLLYMLVAPFFGALAVAAILLLAPLIGLGAWLPPGLPPLGPAAGSAYVWSALPAGLAALGLAPMVLKRGGFGWIEAAAAGVIAVGAAAVLFPFPHQGMLTSIAFLGGLVSVALRAVLLRVGILLASP